MKTIKESELIINGDGSIFHLHLRPEEVADDIILVGDPDRVSKVSAFFDAIECTRQSREFCSATGSYKGKKFTVISTGIGTGNCDIVMNELDALANIDFKTRTVKENPKSLNILRIGTCGAVQPDIELGSFIFSEISVGFDGVLRWYKSGRKVCIPLLGPALKMHLELPTTIGIPYCVKAGDRMTERFSDKCIHGITISACGFYGPQGRTLRSGIFLPDFADRLESFRFNGRKITNIEMEGSVIAGLGRIYGHNCGTICCAIAQRQKKDANTNYHKNIESLIEFALDRML